jgi:hypothetical protein
MNGIDAGSVTMLLSSNRITGIGWTAMLVLLVTTSHAATNILSNR